jgi:hypothetical protein
MLTLFYWIGNIAPLDCAPDSISVERDDCDHDFPRMFPTIAAVLTPVCS